MFVVTPSDVFFGVAVIFSAVVVIAMWVTVTIMDRRTKRRDAERALQSKKEH